MTFLQFAFNNVKRKPDSYLAYLLSSTFSISIFFLYAAFLFSLTSKVGQATQEVAIHTWMQGAEYVIFGFSFLYVIYSVGSFLRARKKEFGLLQLLGISRSQLNRLIFFENSIIGAISVLLGVTLGIVLSKGFYMLIAKLMDMEALSFYLPLKAIGMTVGLFMFLFLVVSLFSPVLLGSGNLLDLLQGSRKPKKKPIASIWLVLLSVGAIGYGYYDVLANGIPKEMKPFLILLGIIIVGTYFFFSQLSVYLMSWLQKRKQFSWKGIRFLFLSELAYQMKDYTRILFIISIILTITFSAIGGFLVLDKLTKSNFESPFEFDVHYQYEVPKQQREIGMRKVEKVVEGELDNHHKKFHRYLLHVKYLGLDTSEGASGRVIPQSEYNALTRWLNQKPVHLKTNQMLVLLHPEDKDIQYYQKELKIEKLRLTLQPLLERDIRLFSDSEQSVFVLPDSLFQRLPNENGDRRDYLLYVVPEWVKSLPRTKSVQYQVLRSVEQKIHNAFPDVYFYSNGLSYQAHKQIFNGLMFIGVFISLLFCFASASFTYFRLYSDLDWTKRQYKALSRIGLSVEEMRRVMTMKLLSVFFLPFVISTMHTIIALNGVQKTIVVASEVSIVEPLCIGLGAFFILQLVLFGMIRHQYLNQIERSMV